ncbi:MAG: hypothetical protein OEY81_04740 [Candidatus Bathyarchaeota archaeon]|nr:hypothetical protein [Candidatus Bathyarchaeota archaeon]
MSGPWEVTYGRYQEAFKAIHGALSQIMAPPPGKRITKHGFTWNANGTLATLKAYDGETLLFTLGFSWNANGTLKEVSRTDA